MSVKIENLSFAYGTHQVLKNISLEVGDGTLVNVLHRKIHVVPLHSWFVHVIPWFHHRERQGHQQAQHP